MAIDLTSEERAYVTQAATADAGYWPALLSSLPYLAPVALFGGYGAAIGDATAVAIALVCLVALNLWWIHSQCRSAALFKAVCVKIAAVPAATDRSDAT